MCWRQVLSYLHEMRVGRHTPGMSPTPRNPAPLPSEGLAGLGIPVSTLFTAARARGEHTPAGVSARRPAPDVRQQDGMHPAPSVRLGQGAAGTRPRSSPRARRLALPGRPLQVLLAGVRSEGANMSSPKLGFLRKGNQR